jgi:hypothetical protein
VFRFLLRLEDGEPNEPAALITAVPNWTVGETFSTARGEEWRIPAIDTEIADELVDQDINAAFRLELGVASGARSRPVGGPLGTYRGSAR